MFQKSIIKKSSSLMYKIIIFSFFYQFSYAAVTNCEQLYRNKEYQKAFVECNNLIQHDDITGAAIIGLMCYHGDMLQQDYTRAAILFKGSKNWFIEQAKQGNVDAKQALGIMYYIGNSDPLYDYGVKKDLKTALYWFSQAAKDGDLYSQVRLGVFYTTGQDGVERDYDAALYWYRKAADMNYAPAQSGLGAMYQYGLGVPKNNTRACSWYKKAILQGDPDAMRYLANNGHCQ